MRKMNSLIKVCLSQDMDIFKINVKGQNKLIKFILPLILACIIMSMSFMYSDKLIQLLEPFHLEYVMLTLFVLFISFMTFMEGVYKSSSLLFNCKDDNLLFSLPIHRNMVLFIRVFKFYVFEFLYNSLFLFPAMLVYALHVSPNWTYYLISLFALLFFPVIPIMLSILIGFIITNLSSKFRAKTIFQTIITLIFLLLIFYLSYNMDGFMNNIVSKASSINDLIIKIYYPVGAYIALIINFNVYKFIIFLVIHMLIFLAIIFLLGIVYFRVNSSFMKDLFIHMNSHYNVRCRSKLLSFVKKELNRFFSTPVFVINASFGLILFLIACIFLCFRYDSFITYFLDLFPNFDVDIINDGLPLVLFFGVCFASFMTSITSSIISLEGRSFNILKTLPVTYFNIALYKVISALFIMIPCIIIGDIIIFIRFKFDLISILLIILATFVSSFVSELIGIIVNLKYPKLNAMNDTEVVKQSMSSMIAVFIGMALFGGSSLILSKLFSLGINNYIIMLIFLGIFIIIGILLWFILVRNCNKIFNNISA